MHVSMLLWTHFWITTRHTKRFCRWLFISSVNSSDHVILRDCCPETRPRRAKQGVGNKYGASWVIWKALSQTTLCVLPTDVIISILTLYRCHCKNRSWQEDEDSWSDGNRTKVWIFFFGACLKLQSGMEPLHIRHQNASSLTSQVIDDI